MRLDQTTAMCVFCVPQIPQTLTGFSQFEMLYGKNIRGSLNVLK